MSVPFLDINTAAILLFILVIAALVWRDRENIEIHSILIIRRTDHGIEILDTIADKAKRFWTWWSTAGIIVGFIVMIGMFLYLLRHTFRILLQPDTIPAVGLVLPTASTQASMTTGAFFIPFWYWIVAIATVAVVHEMMHGVIARNEDFDVKSVGWFILGILPGAFVEPEGEEMFPEEGEEDTDETDDENTGGPWDQGNWISKLRVLGAGSWSNLTIGILVLLATFGMTTTDNGVREVRGVYEHDGVEIRQVVNGTAAQDAGIPEGLVIDELAGTQVQDIRDFASAADGFSVGEQITIRGTLNGTEQTYTATLGQRPDPNLTYNPATLDPYLVKLEKRLPGTISTYHKYNWLVMNEGPETKIERWRWIKNTTPALSDRADQRIAALQDQIEETTEPYLGIAVDPVRTPTGPLGSLAGFFDILLQLFMFLVIIHVGIGSANLLPIKPLDGGWMLSTVIDRYKPSWEHPITLWASILTILLFLINLLVPLAQRFLL